jgi:hypothetical protein
MWQFRKQDHRKWYWKELDDMGRLLRTSAEYFRERIDCVEHAMRNGYIHPRQRALVARKAPQARDPSGREPDRDLRRR